MNQSDLSIRLARWYKLQGYSFEIEHRKRCEIVEADALSRAFDDDDVAAVNVEVYPEVDLASDAQIGRIFCTPEQILVFIAT